MTDLNRSVAGLRCRDVLALLGDYVDGDLSAGDVAQVEAHLRGCDRCEKFGGEYGALVSGLRRRLDAEPAPERAQGAGGGEGGEAVEVRLRERIRALWAGEEGP